MHEKVLRQPMVMAPEFPIPTVPLAGFTKTLAEVLPHLIEFLTSSAVRKHPVWGRSIPFNVPAYGTGVSLGHCIRPDVLLTADGPKICELDFVPSGRGYLLAGLGGRQQVEVFDVFERWYRCMGVNHVLYATATVTMCRGETELFASSMRRHCGFDIRAGNIDACARDRLRGILIDRLAYRSEMRVPEEEKCLRELDVITAEPFLDSKVIFALVHDVAMTKLLERALGEASVAFLREVIPYSQLMCRLDNMTLERIADERTAWVIKNGDVETDHSWGCRGTIAGVNYNRTRFRDVLFGVRNPSRKEIGSRAIVQRWYASSDFREVWNGVVDGAYRRTELDHPNMAPDPKVFSHAARDVGARIGFYFLVARESSGCMVTPYGDLVLRQDSLIHGARDAICLAVRAV